MPPRSVRIQDLVELYQSPGLVHAISIFCFRDNWIGLKDQITGKTIAEKKKPQRLIRNEIASLIGVLLGGSGSIDLPDQSVIVEYLERVERHLEEIHHCMIKDAFADRDADISPLSTGEGIREADCYATESAYAFQYIEFAQIRYQHDDQWLADSVGFTLKDAKIICDAIFDIQSQRAKHHLKSLRTTDPTLWTMLPAFELEKDDIVSVSGLPAKPVVAFFDAFTCDVGFDNSSFKSVTEFNITSERPIVLLGGRHFLFQYVSLTEDIYESPAHWMYEDAAYRATGSVDKGDLTEAMTSRFLKRIFDD